MAGVGRRLLVGAAEPRSPVHTLTTTRRSRGGFGDGCQGVLLGGRLPGAATGGKDGSPDTHHVRPVGAGPYYTNTKSARQW